MASPIVAVSLEFRLESARSRSSRLYSESLRESRLLSSPISDRSRDLVSVQMKSDTAIIFARFPHFRVPIVSHRGAIITIRRLSTLFPRARFPRYRQLETTAQLFRRICEKLVPLLHSLARKSHLVAWIHDDFTRLDADYREWTKLFSATCISLKLSAHEMHGTRIDGISRMYHVRLVHLGWTYRFPSGFGIFSG